MNSGHTHGNAPVHAVLEILHTTPMPDGSQKDVRQGRIEQKARKRWAEGKFMEELGARVQRAGGKVKARVVGEDGLGGVSADQDHEEAPHQAQDSPD
jgi:hypothetical protein